MFMKVTLLFLTFGVLLAFRGAFAFDCRKIEHSDYSALKVVKEEKFLNKDNWCTLDVLWELNYEDCIDSVTQKIIEVDDKHYRLFLIDGRVCGLNMYYGDTYGAIYTMDLQNPVAHIYYGRLTCKDLFLEDKWRAGGNCI